uniref:NmrA domain-containing protein n=1 Tax=Steinernema glaseri TaxID=37863 RepID=A0A1I7ZST6_9BILA
MDAVPPIFVESVCLILDRESFQAGGKIDFMWGEVSAGTSEKIHTLRVIGDGDTGRVYAAAQPLLCDDYLGAVPVGSVNLKFITRFCIQSYCDDLPNSYKEIPLDQVEKLVRLIKPTTEGRPPLRYKFGSSNYMTLTAPTWISKELISMRLPVDSVNMWIDGEDFQAAAEEFFKSAGPLYHIHVFCYSGALLKQSTIDTMIDKFIPVDGGKFSLSGDARLTTKQLERIVLKCEMSDKKVKIVVMPEGATCSSKVTDFFDFDKYYSTKNIEGGKIRAVREGANLEVRVERSYYGFLEWEWRDLVPQERA